MAPARPTKDRPKRSGRAPQRQRTGRFISPNRTITGAYQGHGRSENRERTAAATTAYQALAFFGLRRDRTRSHYDKYVRVMSGRRPCQGFRRGFANVSGAVMSSACCAARIAPLALMIRPHGSSPQSPYRARSGADTCTGFQAFTVGSHHLVVALDADRLGGENFSLPSPFAAVRPRPAGRRNGRPSSSARRRCAPPCWRAPPRSV
jgi:hypothetical protein